MKKVGDNRQPKGQLVGGSHLNYNPFKTKRVPSKTVMQNNKHFIHQYGNYSNDNRMSIEHATKVDSEVVEYNVDVDDIWIYDNARPAMLTTRDNPFDPFENFELWFRYDTQMNYGTCAYLARIAKTSDELSELDNMIAINSAIDEIVSLNISGNYMKVYHK